MMTLGSVYFESLRGSFLGICIYIFGIVMLFLFQMFGKEVQGYGFILMLVDIVSIGTSI